MQYKHILLLMFIVIITASCERKKGSEAKNVNQVSPEISVSAQPIKYFINRYDDNEPDTCLLLQVLIKNLSLHNLRYVSMTCSWEDLYVTDSKNFDVIGHPCQSNHDTIYSLLAGEIRLWQLQVAIKKHRSNNSQSFRVGFLYINGTDIQRGVSELYNYREVNKKTPGKTIWSNEIIFDIDSFIKVRQLKKADR